MKRNRPYSGYKFIGVRTFTALLEEAGVRFVLFDDSTAGAIFGKMSDYFNSADDSIITGKCTQEGIDMYFAEFGIKITPSFRSHVVFIYDHHPTLEDLLASAEDIDQLVQKHLDEINPADITQGGTGHA
ncbi:MAG: hypothetical protein JW807_06590 [Spirochaetes bacterium]|nr:hypothetical protein [Spirochaetota bacterium]